MTNNIQTVYEWLTADEAAAYLRVTKPTIYELVKDGKLKAARITGSRRLRFRKDWIDQWLVQSSELPHYRMPA